MLSDDRTDPRFVTDSNLNKLARWLRILGYDVKISQTQNTAELWRLHKFENRILLTRIRSLVKRAGIGKHTLLIENDPKEQLAIITKQFNLNITPNYHRCTDCNSLLTEVARSQVKGKVPAFIWLTTGYFRECCECRKIYWKGSHLELARVYFRD